MNEINIDPYEALASIVETTSRHNSKSFLDSICQELKKLFQADLVFITQAIEVNPTKNVRIIASSEPQSLYEFNLDGTPCKLTYKGQAVRIEKDIYLNFHQMASTGFESFLGLPIKNENQICIGHISIFSKTKRKYPDVAVKIAKIFTGRIEVEAKNLAYEDERNRLYEELYNQSITDELTKLHNRRFFIKKAKEIHKLVKRDVCKATLSFFDIDDFKALNDKYGHEEGDYVLKTIGKIFTTNHRDNIDFIFRMGGEEFCLISLNNNKESTVVYINKILKNIKDEFKNKQYHITFSIGISELQKEHESWQDAYKEADEKMYLAKRSGKNSISY